MANAQGKRSPAKSTAQKERTRLNKIKKIEREIEKHPNAINNQKMVDRLEQLKKQK